jgi:hypothetical protein
LKADGSQAEKRTTQFNPEGVSLQDCLDGQKIRFTLTTSNVEAGATVQAWATAIQGTDCSAATARGTATQVCWSLDQTLSVSPVMNFEIPVQTLMAGARANASAGALGTPINPDKSPGICGQVDLTTISVEFLYFSLGDSQTAQSGKGVNQGVQVDTIGPVPPSGLTLMPGNGRFKVQWQNINGGDPDAGTSGGTNPQLGGVNVYCDKATTTAPVPQTCEDVPNDGGVDDAGDPIDAGTTQACTGGGTQNVACGSDHLSASADGGPLLPSAALDPYKCGGITGGTGSSITTDKPLENNFKNIGPLSDPVCNYPEETTDFWDDYRKAGGMAGGGCTTSGGTIPVGAAAAVVGFALALSSFIRRRKGS